MIKKLLSILFISFSLSAVEFNMNNWWIEYFSHEREVQWFHLWAFGFPAEKLCSNVERVKAWNLRHGNMYVLTPQGKVSTTLPTMVKLWRATTEQSMKKYFKK